MMINKLNIIVHNIYNNTTNNKQQKEIMNR